MITSIVEALDGRRIDRLVKVAPAASSDDTTAGLLRLVSPTLADDSRFLERVRATLPMLPQVSAGKATGWHEAMICTSLAL